MPQTTEQRWVEYGKQHLLNRTIKKVRYMTAQEREELGWHSCAIVLELDNGTMLYPSADDEENGAGAMFGNDAKGNELTFPVI